MVIVFNFGIFLDNLSRTRLRPTGVTGAEYYNASFIDVSLEGEGEYMWQSQILSVVYFNLHLYWLSLLGTSYSRVCASTYCIPHPWQKLLTLKAVMLSNGIILPHIGLLIFCVIDDCTGLQAAKCLHSCSGTTSGNCE